MKNVTVALVVLVLLPINLSAAQPTLILLSNSIDYALAQDFISYLDDRDFDIVKVDAADFQQYREEKFIVILGGPDAPGGVGAVVQDVLTLEEQEFLRIPGNKAMYVKSKWTQDQRIFVLAGSDRNRTRDAHLDHREELYQNISLSLEVKLTIPDPLPKGSLIVYSGEYVETISYWGYEKIGGYTTVRFQKGYVEDAEKIVTRKNVTVHQSTIQKVGPDPTNITLHTSASSTDDTYNNMWIKITSGAGSGQVRKIIDYNGTLRNATVDSVWDTLPSVGDGYSILEEKRTTYTRKVRPGKFEYRTVYITFKDIELPVRFVLDGVEYEILYYDTEKIIIKK